MDRCSSARLPATDAGDCRFGLKAEIECYRKMHEFGLEERVS
jgi:hypothetical protein